jgi:hypothetical protein
MWCASGLKQSGSWGSQCVLEGIVGFWACTVWQKAGTVSAASATARNNHQAMLVSQCVSSSIDS